MTTKAPPNESAHEIAELRAELGAMHERVARVEGLLVALYGANALGGTGPAPPPPAEPARTLKPFASIGPHFWGASR